MPGGGYGWMSGTSMAAPHVSGAAALALSLDPSLSTADLKRALLAGTDPVAALAGRSVSGGRLNASRTLALAVPPVVAVPPSAALPTDTDGDGRYDDVNGNGRKDFADITLYFNRMAWIGENEPLAAFDYNGNGRIDFADVTWLFHRL
jgi:PKD repeat protein